MSKIIYAKVLFSDRQCRRPVLKLPLFTEREIVLAAWVPAIGEVLLLNDANEIVNVRNHFMAPTIIYSKINTKRYRVFFLYDERVIDELGLCIPYGIEMRSYWPFISSIVDFEKTIRKDLGKLVDEASKILSSYGITINASDKRRVGSKIIEILYVRRRRYIDPADSTVLIATVIKLITEAGVSPIDVSPKKDRRNTKGAKTSNT